MKIKLQLQEAHKITCRSDSSGQFNLQVDDTEHQCSILHRDNSTLTLRFTDGRIVTVDATWENDTCHILHGQHAFTAQLLRASASGSVSGAQSGRITAPLPGRIVDVLVAAGDHVAAGQPVCIIEAMKMQNEICSAAAGVVSLVHTTTDATVESGDLLITLEPQS